MTARPNTFAATPASGIPPAPQPSFLDEALVIAHHQLRFDLLNRIHGHTHHDQQRGAAEIERYVQAFEHEPPHVFIEPGAQSSGQVVQVDTGDKPFGQQADRRQIDAAHKSQPAQDAIDVLGGIAAGAYAGNESTVLAHVVREFGRVEDDADVKEGKKNDQQNIDQSIERLAPG